MQPIRGAVGFLCAIFLSGFYIFSPAAPGNFNDVTLQKFILGRWQGDFRNQTEGSEQGPFVQLEFVDAHTLVFNRVSGGRVYPYNLVFEYYFSADNLIHLQSRYVTDLQLREDGDYLWILQKSQAGWIPSGRYKRVPTIPWSLLSISLGVLCIIMLRKAFKHIVSRPPDSSQSSVTIGRGREWFRIGFQLIATVVFLIIGAIACDSVRLYWGNLLIRPPWDGILMTELSLGIAAVGLEVAFGKVGQLKLPFVPARRSCQHYVGIGVLGFALWGIAVGALFLITFLLFGAYPF
jgi:hypothetical protein